MRGLFFDFVEISDYHLTIPDYHLTTSRLSFFTECDSSEVTETNGNGRFRGQGLSCPYSVHVGWGHKPGGRVYVAWWRGLAVALSLLWQRGRVCVQGRAGCINQGMGLA